LEADKNAWGVLGKEYTKLNGWKAEQKDKNRF
jgi:hypothetical protein